jgi:diadenosine tetraphosphate (Ap4A) HIT family hydrolase
MRDLQKAPFYGVVKEYKDWVVLFRYRQVTIGSLIIMSKSDKAALGELSSQEWAGFAEVTRDVEYWLTNAFGAEKFNYLALMMKDPEVHFHVIPRYSKPVYFSGRKFTDPDWPLATERVALDLDEKILDTIKNKILEIAK